MTASRRFGGSVCISQRASESAATDAIQDLYSDNPDKSCKFIIVVNNMTDYKLHRRDSVGGAGCSWPISEIGGQQCTASWYDQTFIRNLGAEFVAVDHNEPGEQTVVLYASWPIIGIRNIGVFAGEKAQAYPWFKYSIRIKGISDAHDPSGNRANICSRDRFHIFQYDIKKLAFSQFGIDAIDDISAVVVKRAGEHFIDYNGRLYGFTFMVNNLTDHDLILHENQVNKFGKWPLGNIKKRECAVAGFDGQNMALAVQYIADDDRRKSISLAGSWVVMRTRKINICQRRDADYAWRNMTSKKPEEANGNKADIRAEEFSNICVYYYEIRNL